MVPCAKARGKWAIKRVIKRALASPWRTPHSAMFRVGWHILHLQH